MLIPAKLRNWGSCDLGIGGLCKLSRQNKDVRQFSAEPAASSWPSSGGDILSGHPCIIYHGTRPMSRISVQIPHPCSLPFADACVSLGLSDIQTPSSSCSQSSPVASCSSSDWLRQQSVVSCRIARHCHCNCNAKASRAMVMTWKTVSERIELWVCRQWQQGV